MSEAKKADIYDTSPGEKPAKAVKAVPKWLADRKKILDDRRKKNMEEKGLAEFYTLEEGETRLKFLDHPPREDTTGEFGVRTIFRVKVLSDPDAKEPEYDLSASDALSRKILNALEVGINPLTIIRVGEEKNTRYSIKELKKKKNVKKS